MPTKTELLCKAKELGLRGYTGMNKARLEEFVNANTPKKLRVKRPKVSKKTTPPIDTSALDEAKKYLEDLEQKKIVKGVAKLKDTISKGKAENLLRKAMAKYKASKTMKKAQPDTDETMKIFTRHYKDDIESYGVMGEMGDDSYRIGRLIAYTINDYREPDRARITKTILEYIKDAEGFEIGEQSSFIDGYSAVIAKTTRKDLEITNLKKIVAPYLEN